MRKRARKFAGLTLVAVLALSSSGLVKAATVQDDNVITVEAISTSEPTATPSPAPEATSEPEATSTPEPTMAPTPEPEPTATPQPTINPSSFKKKVYFKNTGTIYVQASKKSAVLGKGVKYKGYKTTGEKVGSYTKILFNDKTIGYTLSSNLTTKKPVTNIVTKSGSVYSYVKMKADLTKLKNIYSDYMSVKNLGQTADKRNIYCVIVGNPNAKKQIVVNASLHAREYLNTYFVMEILEQYLNNYTKKSAKIGMTYEKLFNEVALYIIPMANPDGVTIAQYGPSKINNKTLRKNVTKMLGRKSYRTWKANARGVDLNRNFPSGWGKSPKTNKAGAMYYAGSKAASEKETKILMKFMNSLSNPVANINYHSMGAIVYWDYAVKGTLRTNITKMATTVRSLTKYKLMRGSGSNGTSGAVGGFGDWSVYAKKIPSITIETGTVSCPLPFSQYSSLYSKNKYVIEMLTKQYY